MYPHDTERARQCDIDRENAMPTTQQTPVSTVWTRAKRKSDRAMLRIAGLDKLDCITDYVFAQRALSGLTQTEWANWDDTLSLVLDVTRNFDSIR